jgi:sugar phosphate permease
MPASSRMKRIQRTSVALLVLGCALNYVDRSALAIANPLIRKDLHLNIADMGLLLSAFLLVAGPSAGRARGRVLAIRRGAPRGG